MSDTTVLVVLGTRPEIVKLAPVVRALRGHDVSFSLVHTGQHYSEQLNEVFFRQLDLPTPDRNLAVGSDSHGAQTGAILAGVETAIDNLNPATVLVQGDTNSVLAGALAAAKLDTTLGHIEAGLRSFDRSMPEEINRIVADHVADELFAPTDHAADQLQTEGIPKERIAVTGNTVVDAVEQHREIAAEKSTVHADLGVTAGSYVLLTAHRAENVDEVDRLAGLLDGADRVARRFDGPVIYPIHPRAREQLDAASLTPPETIRLVEPLDYLDFLRLQAGAQLILTDSGGVQEEACTLGVPCVTLRDNTERPETVSVGANVLAGVEPDRIVAAAVKMADAPTDWENPFGDGRAGERIVETFVSDVNG